MPGPDGHPQNAVREVWVCPICRTANTTLKCQGKVPNPLFVEGPAGGANISCTGSQPAASARSM